jgi:hypothetical protein
VAINISYSGKLKKTSYHSCLSGYNFCQKLFPADYVRPLVLRFPGRSVQAGSGRKVPEIDGTWKQYFWSEELRIFPVSSDQILVFSGGKWPEVAEKIRKLSGPEYCFRFPSISGVFLSETMIFPDLFDRF